jgi:energy-coupling factor transporter ATP-binding protein EcfA2
VVSPAAVVLLDEPTTSLDAEAARQVIGAIRSATRDRTVLLVTHDPALAAIADRTVPVGALQPRSTPRVDTTTRRGPVAAGPAAPRDAVRTGGRPRAKHVGGARVLVSATLGTVERR